MASVADSIVYGDFVFYNNFDSANLARVEQLRVPEIPAKGSRNIVACRGRFVCPARLYALIVVQLSRRAKGSFAPLSILYHD